MTTVALPLSAGRMRMSVFLFSDFKVQQSSGQRLDSSGLA